MLWTDPHLDAGCASAGGRLEAVRAGSAVDGSPGEPPLDGHRIAADVGEARV